MSRFTTENITGYDAAAVADLNAAYSVRLAELRSPIHQSVEV